MKNNDELISQILEEHEKEVGMKEIQERGYHARTILHKAFKLMEKDFNKKHDEFAKFNQMQSNANKLLRGELKQKEAEFRKRIDEEKEIVNKVCLGLTHPSQDNQKEFTNWLQQTVNFHLSQLLFKIGTNHSQKEKPKVFIERAGRLDREGIRAVCGTDEEYSNYVKKMGAPKGCGKKFCIGMNKPIKICNGADYLCEDCTNSDTSGSDNSQKICPQTLPVDNLSSKIEWCKAHLGSGEFIHTRHIKEFIKRRLEKIDSLHKELTFGQSVKDCTHMKDVCPMWIIYRDFRDNAGRKLAE